MRRRWRTSLSPNLADAAIRPVAADLIALRAVARALPHAGQGCPTTGLVTGNHAGLQRGRGLDFAELRAYQPGDDARSIDWRRTARHGRPCTRVYQTERERSLRLLVDLGASMRFGTRTVFKSVAAARAATLLAWQAEAAGDRVAALVRHAAWREVPLQARRAGVLALIHALENEQGDRDRAAESFSSGLQRLARRTHSGDRLVLLSDFRELDAPAEALLQQLGRRAECFWVAVHDPFEAEPPPSLLALTDGSESVTVDFRDSAVRARHVSAFAEHRARLETLARGAQARLLHLATSTEPAMFLAAAGH